MHISESDSYSGMLKGSLEYFTHKTPGLIMMKAITPHEMKIYSYVNKIFPGSWLYLSARTKTANTWPRMIYIHFPWWIINIVEAIKGKTTRFAVRYFIHEQQDKWRFNRFSAACAGRVKIMSCKKKIQYIFCAAISGGTVLNSVYKFRGRAFCLWLCRRWSL